VEEILLFIVLGLGSGALISGISLGVVLTYRGSGIINLSVGAMAMLGGYAFWALTSGKIASLPSAAALPIALLFVLACGALVEKISGRPLAQFLDEEIFAPLGMTDTVAHEEGISTVNHRAFGYTHEAGRWNRTDQDQTSAVLGDGGIYSSIDDLAKWDAALYDERLLQPSSLRAAFTPTTHTDDPEIEYGYGWRITGETLWHSGESVGFRNVIVRYPKRHLTVVVLTNRNEPEPYQLALEIAKTVIG